MGNMNGSYGSHYTLWQDVTINSQSTSANSTNVTVKMYLTFDGSGYYAFTNSSTGGNMTIDGNTQDYSISSINFSSGVKKDILLAEWTGDIEHESNGEKTLEISGSWNTNNSRIGSGTTNNSIELTKINRYPSFTTNPYVTRRGLETLTFSYGAVDMASSIYYSLDNKTWNPIYSQITKITGLKPNTKYTLYIQARNQQDTSLYTTFSLKTSTLDMARITEAPNIDVETNPTIYFTNPSGVTATLYAVAKIGDKSIPISDRIEVTTLNSYTLPLYHDIIYQNFTTTNIANIRYAITTKSSEYMHWVDRVGNIKNSNPLFNNYTYKDNNEKVTELTGSNQKVILGYSNISVTVPVANKATALNYAQMEDYKVLIGQKSNNFSYSDTADTTSGILEKINSKDISVYANDSRGNSTEVKKTMQIVDYSKIKIKTLVAQRENNIGESVILEFAINFWNGNFGNIDNGINSLAYKFKKTGDNEYITGKTTLSYNIIDNQIIGSVSIKGDSSNGGFEIDDTYDIELFVSDKLSEDKASVVLGTGNPGIAIYKNKVAIGQAYDTTKGGALQVNGEIFASGLEKGIIENINNINNKIDYVEDLTSVGNYIKRRKVRTDEEVWVSLSGVDITIPQGWSGYTVGTLPEGHRPKQTIEKTVVGRLTSNISSSVILTLTYKASGVISIINLGSAVNIQYLKDYEKFSIL